MPEKKPLDGMAALVTGASSGMGLESARLLAEDGAAVTIMGRRESKLHGACEALRSRVPGARIEAFVGDAAEKSDAITAIEAAHSMSGRLDIIVSAVGGGVYKPLLMCDENDMVDEYRTSTLTAFYMIRHGVPRMERNGSIVCVSSTAGGHNCPGLAPYNAAKAALEMLVKAAAEEVGSIPIRVNAVRPGFTRAEGTAEMFADPELVKTFDDWTPMGRAGESIDLARAIRFLAGPESGWVTGQIFAADGGQELRGAFPDPYPTLEAIYGKDVIDAVRAGRPPEA